MPDATLLLIVVIVIALAFDFINGFHDAANSIATVVSTRVLTPMVAVIWAAFFNFIAFLFFHTGVATTISSKLVNISASDPLALYVVLSGLIGAIVWNLLTWWWGLPSSSSHALMGGYAGAAMTHAALVEIASNHQAGVGTIISTAFNALILKNWILPVLFIFLAPLFGMVLGRTLDVFVTWLCRNQQPTHVNGMFRRLQLLSAAAYSLGHGGNDAQKTMGIIGAALIATGHLGKGIAVPLWVVLICHAAMGLGTLSGGWRIVHTMGQRLTKLQPFSGFCAETAGAITLFLATYLKVPVSTTHVITGGIVGVGSARRMSAVRWGVAANIVWAWVFTIPLSAIAAAVASAVVRLFVS